MEASEVMEWQVWLALEPRGQLRADYRSAQITHAVYTILQSFSKSSQKISLQDNLLKFTQVEDISTNIEEQNKKNAMAMMSVFGNSFTGEMSKLAKDVKDTFSEEVDY
jgi:hypothetical protein